MVVDFQGMPVAPERRWVRMLRTKYTAARRCMALVSAVLSLWVLVGSWMFPSWWFGLLWGGKFDRQYITDGFQALLDSYYFLLVAIVVAAFLFAIVVMVFKNRLFRVLDRFAVPIAVSAGFVLLITAFVVYHTQRENYLFEQTMETDLLVIKRANAALLRMGSAHHVAEPVDFHYIDTARISAL